MRGFRRIIALVAPALLLAALFPAVGGHASPIPPTPALWVVGADGSGERKLVEGGFDYDWSPAGDQMAVSTGYEITIVEAASGDKRTLPSGFDGAWEPRWSPDGSTIAYRYCEDGRCGIAGVSPEGGDNRVLLDAEQHAPVGLSWSPDSSQIAFIRGEGSGVPGHLHVLDVGSGVVSLVSPTPAFYAETEWSRDGEWISFLEWKTDNSYGLSVVRPDGSDERSVTGVSYVGSHEWSPVDDELAFSGSVRLDDATYVGVFLVGPSDTTPRLLQPNAIDPTWSPDGDEMAFSYEEDLWVRPMGGGEGRSLTTENLRDDRASDWSPAGEWIAFIGTRVQVLCGGLPYPAEANVIGTPGDDVLNGTPEADVIAGRGGNDTIRGLEGNDLICGDDGDDVVDGGPGDDTVYGNRGADEVVGGSGNDDLEGSEGNDSVDGGDGSDLVTFSSGRGGVNVDLELGRAEGHGTDSLTGIENVTGTGKDDILAGDGGRNVLHGAGTFWTHVHDKDVLMGRGGPDSLSGFSGPDRLRGGPGRDRLRGGEGNDNCRGGPGRDSIRGC